MSFGSKFDRAEASQAEAEKQRSALGRTERWVRYLRDIHLADEAWQNGHVMRADKITFDRNTGVAAATGHVVLLEPDGEVLFADYAEMRNKMNDEQNQQEQGEIGQPEPPQQPSWHGFRTNILRRGWFSCSRGVGDPFRSFHAAGERTHRRCAE